MQRPPYTAEEIAERGRELYDTRLKEQLEPHQRGRYVVMDVISGEYLVGDDYTRELHARQPDAPLYTKKIGYRAAGRLRRIRMAAPQRSAGVPPAPAS